MEESLQRQKQAVVRDALYDAAIDLFAQNGFDETRVEDVAVAAGVSRRTFFRYFETKDDLLAHSVLQYKQALAAAVESFPDGLSPMEAVARLVRTGAGLIQAREARTRLVIKISERSSSARQAYQSRMMEVEEALAGTLATYFGDASPLDLRPRLLATIALHMVNLTVISWFLGCRQDLATAAESVIQTLQSSFDSGPTPRKSKKQASTAARAKASKQPRLKHR